MKKPSPSSRPTPSTAPLTKPNPADHLERWPIDRLVPYARNSRTHSDEQVAQIAASIREWGWTTPILVDAEGGIIAGHGRVLAARKLGISEVPVIIATGWSDEQKRAYVIADNKLALNAGWDNELLNLELQELSGLGFNMELTGFTDEEIKALMPVEVTEGLMDEDDTPPVPEQAVSVPGDIWMMGKHRLMCGDSTSVDAVDRLMAGQKADMVFTDPPYGVDYDGGHATEKRREKLQNDDDVNMYDLPIKNAFLASKDEAPIYLWFADRFATDVIKGLSDAGYQVRCWIIWNKNVAQFGAIGAQYKAKHEPCIYAFKKGKAPNWNGPTNEVTVWDLARDHRNEHHPTQKPTALAERAMGNHTVKLVLDLFGGSGSTLIAAEKTGRNARLMELDPKYCDVIIKRWQDFTGKQAVHLESGKTFAEVSNGGARAEI
jgi:DNA modification methylase